MDRLNRSSFLHLFLTFNVICQTLFLVCSLGHALIEHNPVNLENPRNYLAGKTYVGVYADGPLQVKFLSVPVDHKQSAPTTTSEQELPAAPFDDLIQQRRRGSSLPPKPLLIAVPTASGRYPVIVLQHGYSLQTVFYGQLMQHVASHGFILVAPQMYQLSGPDSTNEIEDAATVITWLTHNIAAFFGQSLLADVIPNFEKLVISGHSRGGKVAFGLALGKAHTSFNFSAIMALDPVDGSADSQTKPPILTFKNDSFHLEYPTLIVGSGLGPDSCLLGLIPPCAPEKFGHREFFAESSSPAFHFVPIHYGHMDFLDDRTSGIEGTLSYIICKEGPSRCPMRRSVGGIMISFLQSALFGETANLEEALNNPSSIPVAVQPPQSYFSLISKTSVVLSHDRL